MKATTAESCTGGLLAAAITSVAGSSDVFEAGYVTYADHAKVNMIGVPKALINAYGAVSSETAAAMAKGACTAAGADFAVAVTGIAGPGGGSPDKPVGLVFIAVATKSGTAHAERHAFGDIGRHEVRLASVRAALASLIEAAA